MAQTKYTYSIASDTLNGILDLNALQEEIRSSAIITAHDYNNSLGDSLDIYMKDALSAGDKTLLDGVVSAHTGEALPDDFIQKVASQESPAFAAKTLPDGKKLFKRVHGVTISINNETKNIELVVPYNSCKITGVELIGGSIGDKINLKVLDTPTGTISTVPNYMLNQFGFDVYISKDFHEELSQYDADLIKDMKLCIEYTTTDSTKNVYANFILHEVV